MVCHLPPRSYLIGLFIKWSDSTDIHSFWYNYFLPFWILIVPFLYTFVTGYGPLVRGVDNFRRIPGVSTNTWSPTLFSFIRNLTVVLVFFLIGLIDNVMFSFLYSIPVCSEGNIVDHISAKHKLTWCCLQCCMIGASHSLNTMQLIEGSNKMDYLLVLLDFHDCFPSQIIWTCHWQLCVLAQWLYLLLYCVWVVTCSWFGFNAIIVISHICLNSRLISPIFPLSKTIHWGRV
jgi:hypothetical protein